MKRQTVSKVVAGVILILSLVFASLTTVYWQQETKRQASIQQQVKRTNQKQQQDKQKAQGKEQLINDQAYQKRALTFLNRALAKATAGGDLSEQDQTYGSEDAYDAIQGMAGMNSALKLTKQGLHFNKMADGEVVGDGQLEIEASGVSDDAKAKTRHTKNSFTVLMTFATYQKHLRIESIQLGEVKASENANDTIY
jgi:uncharacterized RmlC-like cupin family protein